MLQKGDKAFDFNLSDAKGQKISLSQFKGKKVVIYFYPKDDTPGCTTQACGLRDVYDDILAKGAVVVGISADSEASHAKFMDKYSLPFFLASDPEKTAIQAYGAWGEKKMYGKVYEGIIRSTFIVDEEGMIANVFPKANPKTHAQDVLAAL